MSVGQKLKKFGYIPMINLTMLTISRTHSIGRVHGPEVFLNWNGENRNKNAIREYFQEMPQIQ